MYRRPRLLSNDMIASMNGPEEEAMFAYSKYYRSIRLDRLKHNKIIWIGSNGRSTRWSPTSGWTYSGTTFRSFGRSHVDRQMYLIERCAEVKQGNLIHGSAQSKPSFNHESGLVMVFREQERIIGTARWVKANSHIQDWAPTVLRPCRLLAFNSVEQSPS
jgi:hypothetical protein